MAEKGQVDIVIKGQDKASKTMETIGGNAKTMGNKIRKASAVISTIATVGAASLVKLVNNYSKAGDEVAKMAKKTGWSAESLSEMRYVASLAGTDIKSLGKASTNMSRAITGARDGLSTYTRSFDRLGISVTDLEGLKPEEQFWILADSVADLKDHNDKATTAMELFGKAGQNLLPMLEEGSEAIAEQREECHELNLAFSDEAAKAAESFEDTKTKLVGAFVGIGGAIAEELMPHIETLIKALTEKLKVVMQWFSEHPELRDAFFKWGGILLGLAIAGGPIMMFVSALRGMILSLIAVKSLMGPAGWWLLAGAVTAASIAVAALGSALGMGPLGFLKNKEKGMSTKWEPEPDWKETSPFGTTVIPIRTKEGKSEGLSVPAPYKSWEEAYEAGLRPENMQYGGVVPGRIGEPQPIIAHGGEHFLGPIGRAEAGGISSVVVNVYGDLLTDDALEEKIRSALIKVQNRNVTTGIV